MALTTYESSVKTIQASQQAVYTKLADLNNLQEVKDKLPDDKIKDLAFDADSVSCSIAPVGNVTFRIIEREPFKCIKFESSNLPITFNMWVQIVPLETHSCKLRLVARADINMFLKGMVEKPVKEMLEKLATVLALISYE